MVRFKRLTGRHEAAITPRDYNFFSPRVKHRRTPQHSLSVGSLPVSDFGWDLLLKLMYDVIDLVGFKCCSEIRRVKTLRVWQIRVHHLS